jgi:hypothetical protein
LVAIEYPLNRLFPLSIRRRQRQPGGGVVGQAPPGDCGAQDHPERGDGLNDHAPAGGGIDQASQPVLDPLACDLLQGQGTQLGADARAVVLIAVPDRVGRADPDPRSELK